MARYIMFDLDGTLTESGPGILNCFDHAMEKMNASFPADFDKNQLIGPPLAESFRNVCGFEGEVLERAIRFYRERYAEKGAFENSLYQGIPELLPRLKEDGCVLMIATSKALPLAEKIAAYFQIDSYFQFIAGSLPDGRRGKKQEVIEYLLQENNITDKNQVLMVGDRRYDVQGASECGIKTIGVTYGYGSRTELEEAGAYAVCDDTETLYNAISEYFQRQENMGEGSLQ